MNLLLFGYTWPEHSWANSPRCREAYKCAWRHEPPISHGVEPLRRVVRLHLFSTHAALVDACRSQGAASAHDELTALGGCRSSPDSLGLGDTGNRTPPRW